MELMELFAHLTDIIYVNLGRRNKSLFFQNWDYSSSTMMQYNIHHSDSDTAANQHLGGLKAGCLEAGMLFYHYEMSVLEHHLTHWLKKKQIQFLADQLSDFNHVRYRIFPTSFHPVRYTSVPDYPKNNIFSVVPYSTLQLVCNSSKKKLILQTLECKKCLFPPLKMITFQYLPSPVEPWWHFPCVWGSITGA